LESGHGRARKDRDLGSRRDELAIAIEGKAREFREPDARHDEAARGLDTQDELVRAGGVADGVRRR
jgi:hypothetical protein